MLFFTNGLHHKPHRKKAIPFAKDGVQNDESRGGAGHTCDTSVVKFGGHLVWSRRPSKETKMWFSVIIMIINSHGNRLWFSFFFSFLRHVSESVYISEALSSQVSHRTVKRATLPPPHLGAFAVYCKCNAPCNCWLTQLERRVAVCILRR